MKLLCHLYRLHIFLGVFSAPLQSKAGYVNLHESKFNDQIEFFRSSEEHEWVCFFYLKESNKFAATSYTSTSILDLSLRGNPGLVDAWEVYNDANLSDAIRKNPVNLESLYKLSSNTPLTTPQTNAFKGQVLQFAARVFLPNLEAEQI